MGAGAVPHPRAQMKVLIHDFDGNRNSVPNNVVRSELLRAPGEFNVITMEFPSLVQDPCFNTAVENSPAIGRCLAQFLYSFVKQGLVHPRDIHLIGHGIGAHIAGFAAKTLRGLQIRLGHITGLDPAKHPSFTSIDKRLDVSDAQFVDIIHTDVMQYGKREPIGHVDFYVNMGLAQPDCRTGEYCEYSRNCLRFLITLFFFSMQLRATAVIMFALRISMRNLSCQVWVFGDSAVEISTISSRASASPIIT